MQYYCNAKKVFCQEFFVIFFSKMIFWSKTHKKRAAIQ